MTGPGGTGSCTLDGARVLVTGGAGFIGSHVVDLLARRHVVTVIDDLSVGRPENLLRAMSTGRVLLLEADVRDPDAIRDAFLGQDVVFHLAVQCLRLSLTEPDLVHEVNVTGTLNALRAARDAGAGRFVFVSSSEVYGSAAVGEAPIAEGHPLEPTTPYGASKAAGELYATSFMRSRGLPVTVVRPFNSYGPRSHASGPYGEVIPRFVARALAGQPPVIFGDGRQTRDLTFVEDTARGIVAAASDAAAGRTVNIASGREVSISKLAEFVVRACGREDLRPVFEPPRPGDVRRHLASTERAERLLGFRGAVGLMKGLQRYVEWVRRTGVEVGAEDAGVPNW